MFFICCKNPSGNLFYDFPVIIYADYRANRPVPWKKTLKQKNHKQKQKWSSMVNRWETFLACKDPSQFSPDGTENQSEMRQGVRVIIFFKVGPNGVSCTNWVIVHKSNPKRETDAVWNHQVLFNQKFKNVRNNILELNNLDCIAFEIRKKTQINQEIWLLIWLVLRYLRT